MLWSQFKQAVIDCMGPDGVRRGLEAFRDQHIANAVIDLQRYVPSMRVGNVTTFTAADMTAESQAMVGAMPLGAKVKALYIYSTASGADPNCRRHRLDFYPWARRQDMVCGRLDFTTWWGGCNWRGCGGGPCPVPPAPTTPGCCPEWWGASRAYVYAISPHLDNFVIYPALTATTNLLMVWDGFKSSFSDGDVVPYAIEVSEAVSAYVLSKVKKTIDKNREDAADSWNDYVTARRALVREYRDNLSTDGQDDEYAGNLVVPEGVLAAAGADPIPVLQNITAVAGVTPNCLQAIPTASLVGSVPLAVVIYIAGDAQMWTLKAGADATDVANGICRAVDWATTGLIWYQTSI